MLAVPKKMLETQQICSLSSRSRGITMSPSLRIPMS